MSALSPEADILMIGIDVGYVPKADMSKQRTLAFPHSQVNLNCLSSQGTFAAHLARRRFALQFLGSKTSLRALDFL